MKARKKDCGQTWMQLEDINIQVCTQLRSKFTVSRAKMLTRVYMTGNGQGGA